MSSLLQDWQYQRTIQIDQTADTVHSKNELALEGYIYEFE